MLSICIGLFLSFLDTSIIATAIYTIGVEFHSLSQVNWIALSYTLAYIGCTAIFASLSDVIGRRNAYIAAYVIFLAFSLGCGFAQNLNQLIAMRALQGVGGSGLYSVGFVILGEISPPRVISMLGAMAGAIVAMSGILGPVLGGVITNYTSWRWIFWINAPIGIIPLICFVKVWSNQALLQKPKPRTFKQIDFLGFLLLVASSVPFVIAFQQAGVHVLLNNSIWSSALFIAPLVVGTLCFVALFAWEWFIARRWPEAIGALFPMRLAKNRVYMSAIATTMLTGFPYFVIIYSLPTRFQVVNGKSALGSGVALLPMLSASAIGSTLAGAASSKKNNTFAVNVVGAALMLIGTATLSTLDNTVVPQARAYALQIFVGLGFGLTVSNSTLLAGFESEPRDTAVAQGLMAQVRVLGASIGIAASTVILGIKQRQQLLNPMVLDGAQLESLRESLQTLSPAGVVAVRQAYTDAFNETLVVCAVISGIALLATFAAWRKHPTVMRTEAVEV
jgi:MFS family permease